MQNDEQPPVTKDDELLPLKDSTKRKVIFFVCHSSVWNVGCFLQVFGYRQGPARFFQWMGSKFHSTCRESIAGVPISILNNDSPSYARRPVVIYIHGGAFFMDMAGRDSVYKMKLAQDTGLIVLSPDYRLAPQHPFPAALDDCLAVTNAVLNLSRELPGMLRETIDPNQVFLVGDSAGGNLVLSTALELIRNKDFRLKAIAACCPWLQIATMSYESYQRHSYMNRGLAVGIFSYAGIPHFVKRVAGDILRDSHTSDETRLTIAPYLAPSDPYFDMFNCLIKPRIDFELDPELKPVDQLAADTRAWPLLASEADLAKLPPTFLQLCSRDPFRDEGLAFAERVRKAKAECFQVYLVPFAQHCEGLMSIMFDFDSQSGQMAYRNLVEFIKSSTSPETVLLDS